MKNPYKIIFTCDIDWAPEFAIASTIEFFLKKNVSPIFFATHDSPVLKESHCEIGIHPYFSRVTEDQYTNEIKKLKSIYPNAKFSRSHRNYFGYYIPELLISQGIQYDLSVITWLHPTIINRHFTGLTTMTYSWEDGLHYSYGLKPTMDSLPIANGTWILNAHPMMLYLNAASNEHRLEAVKGISDLTRSTRRHFSPYINRGYGMRTIIGDFLDQFSCNEHHEIWSES